MLPQAPIDVPELPPPSAFLNYPRQGPPVGAYLGPNIMGEYLTVVSRDIECSCPKTYANYEGPEEDCPQHGRYPGPVRVGLAYGVYTIDGQPTDTEGLPPEVRAMQIQAQWRALKNPATHGR